MLPYFNKIWILIILCFLDTELNSQIKTKESKNLLFDANQKFDYGDYPRALTAFEKLRSMDSLNDNINYKIAVCKFEIKKLRPEAKNYFEKIDGKYYPEKYYYLGKLYHAEMKFEKSIENYRTYLKLKAEKEHNIKEVDDLLEKSYFAMAQLKSQNNDIFINNLGNKLNSDQAEYAPLVPQTENKIYFTSRRKNEFWNSSDALGEYYEDIYVSEFKDSVWQKPILLDTTVNSPFHDAGTGISANGKKLLIYHTSEDHVHGHIYESTFINSSWTKPVSLEAKINSPKYNETSACFSPDGEMIFFSSDRPGGYGGKDIYSIRKAPNGKWAVPMNLGPNINTEYNEDAPFVDPHENVLYFSSEGHQNIGGFDVFKSNYDEAEHFSKPINLGNPINTVEDDIFFVVNEKGTKGYMSSKREGGFGLYDLYSITFNDKIPYVVYDIKAFDKDTTEIKKLEIVLIEMDKHQVYGEYRSNSNTGKCIVVCKPYSTYRIEIKSPGFNPIVIERFRFTEELNLTFKLEKSK